VISPGPFSFLTVMLLRSVTPSTWEETMSNMRVISGASLAAAAALLLMAGCSSYDKSAQSAEVQCSGINACKGQSACKTASSSCKGLNACKGQGWVPTASAEDCTSQGGKVI
jgi:hypothetical protein